MYQPVVLFIGLRYMHGRMLYRFDSFTSWLSIIGIIISVTAIIMVLSVMESFEYKFENNILNLIPQAIIYSKTGSLNPQQIPEITIRKIKGIKQVVPLTISDVILQSNYGLEIGVMLGIDPMKKDSLMSYIIGIKQDDLKSGKYNVIIGSRLAEKLKINIGNKLRLIVPNNINFTLAGRLPNQRLFNVVGIFSSNSEVDDYQILVNIQDASQLMHYPSGNITGWRLWLDNPLQIDKLIQKNLPYGAKWYDWREQKGELFQAMRIEKNMMLMLLSLIFVVAVCNIISSLGLIIIEKQKELAILKTQGLTKQQIMTIFIIQGTGMGIIGSLLGTILGVLLTSHINRLMLMLGFLLDDSLLLVKINLINVTYIALTTIIITLISTFYPSWRAASSQPAEILRYE